jgi:hypothetical protein
MAARAQVVRDLAVKPQPRVHARRGVVEAVDDFDRASRRKILPPARSLGREPCVDARLEAHR